MEQVGQELLGGAKIAAEYDTLMTSSPTLKWGILGTGGIAGLFTREVLAAGGEVVAVASRSLEKANDFKTRFGSGRYGLRLGAIPAGPASEGGAIISRAYGSYEELIADEEVDAIYIATPHSEHHTWTLKALNGGKPLLIEKAITQNAKQAEDIFNLAREKNLFVMEAMWTRFLPHIREVKEIIASGKIGEIVTLHANFGIYKQFDPKHRLFNPDLAGGALLDLGVYPVSFSHHILGVPSSITAKGAAAPTGVDANLALIFEHNGGSGAQSVLHTTSLSNTSTTASICGTHGRIDIHSPFYRPSNFTVTLNDETTYTYNGKLEQRDFIGEDGRYGMHFEAAEVARCIAAGKLESDLMSWNDSLEVMRIMDEIRNQIGLVLPNE